MKVLLLGEYSRLHNSLKEGLLANGCGVTLLGDGDGFKNYPCDISIQPKVFNNTLLKYLKLGLFKITGWDITQLERGARFYFQLSNLRGFDVVQLINERPIKTYPSWERYLLKRVFKQNKKIVLLSCGADYASISYALQHKEEVSILTPYFENPNLKPYVDFALAYVKEPHEKTHHLVFEKCDAIIASDIDYVAPLQHFWKFKGLIPNPVILNEPSWEQEEKKGNIKIFLGINRGNYYTKGISFFEEALQKIKKKYSKKVTITKTENLPYATYLSLLNDADIIMDQVYSNDQGYNALENMALGKVVFTGASKVFLDHYNINEDEVCINAEPNVDYLVEKLSYLIENPSKIFEIGKNARQFIEREHHYKEVAKKYLVLYQSLP
ncbi:MAG: glycosyltransferase [Flavobacteriaceae bacterium]